MEIPISGSAHYDRTKLRIILPKKEVMRLPIKEVTNDELHGFGNFDCRTAPICQWEYNPAHYYNGLGRAVVGHDLKYRYRVKEE